MGLSKISINFEKNKIRNLCVEQFLTSIHLLTYFGEVLSIESKAFVC